MARKTNIIPMYAESKGDTRPRSKRDDLVQALMQQQAFNGETIYSVPQGLTKVAQMGLMGYLDTKKDREEKNRHKQAGDNLFGTLSSMLTGGSKPAVSNETSSLAKVLKGEPLAPSVDTSYADRVIGVESGGNPNAKNPRSSATGPGQFIDSTWLSTVQQTRPDLMQGRSREEVLNLRTDPGISAEMTEAYGQQNARILAERGLPVNEATKYLAHFAGPGGAVAILTGDPNAPAAQLLGRHVVEANPFLEGMTAADIQQWASDKMGGGAGAEQLRGEGGPMQGQMPQVQPAAYTAPPAPEAAQIAPGQPQQPYAVPQAPQAAPEASQQASTGSFMQPQEMEMLRALYDSGEMSGADVASYVQGRRQEYLQSQQPEWEYKDGQWYRIGQNGPEPFGEPNEAAQAQGNEFGLTPMYVQDAEGNVVPTQLSKRGGAQPIQMPEGYSVPSGVDKIDLGTQWALQDKRTGQVVGYLPKDIAGEAAQKEIGQQTGEAQMGLGNALAKADQAIDIIDQMLAHPGRETGTGTSSVVDPRNYIPGTDATNFHVMAQQLQGKAFLEAFETLKGGGQITQVEGEKAQAAIARLSTRQSDEVYAQSLMELRGIIEAGKARAQQRAGQQPQAVPAQAPSTTSTGVPWRVIE